MSQRNVIAKPDCVTGQLSLSGIVTGTSAYVPITRTTPTLGNIVNQRSSQPVTNTGLGDIVMVTKSNQQGSALRSLLNNKKAGLKNDAPNFSKIEGSSMSNNSLSPSKPTLGDIIHQGNSRTDTPTSTIPCVSSDPSIHTTNLSHKPTLGDIIHQGSSRTDTPTSRESSDTSILSHKPTLGEIIACRNTDPAPLSHATPTLGDIIGGSIPGDMSGYNSAPSLASIICSTSHTHYNETTTTLSSNKVPSLFDLISPGQTALNSTPGVIKEGVSLSGRGPPGFSSAPPLVADPFGLARQITIEASSHDCRLISKSGSRSHGNKSPEDRVGVSVSIVPPLMVGVVLTGNHGDFWVDSEVLDKRKELIMRKIRMKVFSRKQFNFSTPSPDDYALEKQKKGFGAL